MNDRYSWEPKPKVNWGTVAMITVAFTVNLILWMLIIFSFGSLWKWATG